MEGGGSNWFLIGEGGELGEGWGGEEREAGAIERGDGDGFGFLRLPLLGLRLLGFGEAGVGFGFGTEGGVLGFGIEVQAKMIKY